MKQRNAWLLIGGIILIGVYIMKEKISSPVIIKLYKSTVDKFCTLFNVLPEYVYAIIKKESEGFPFAVGPTNDFGLMQITQPALTDFNRTNKTSYTLLDVWLQPTLNIRVGTWYLSWLLKQFNNDYRLAVSAYNQGIGNVKQGKYSETYYLTVLSYTTDFQGV